MCIDDMFSKPIVLYGGNHAVYKFIDRTFEEYDYCKKKKKKKKKKRYMNIVGYVINYSLMKIKK